MAAVKSLSKHLIQHNWWIHITTITIIAFIYSMTIAMPIGQLVYLHSSKWIAFFKFLGILFLFYSPAILYGYFRDTIHKSTTQYLKYIIWILTFVAFPFSFLLLDAPVQLSTISIMPENLTLIGIFVLLVEVITNPKPIFQLKTDLSAWKNKVSPEWIVVIIFILFAIYFAIQLEMGYGSQTSGFRSGFWLGIQCGALCVAYYLFYLINHYFLVNKIYRTKGVVYYFFGFIALVSLFTIPISLIYYYFPAFKSILQYKLGTDWIGPNAPTAFWSIYLGSIIFLMILTIPLTILVQWIGMAQKVNALEKEKTDTELNLLKQQINPHFFFNTLNNIYAMSRKKSENTPEAILQLSDLMRYVIYNGQENTVSINQEVKYIEDYIDLQRLRLHQNFDYTFDIEVANPEASIIPLLFIILVENAFKHGIEVASEDSYLHLTLEQKGRNLTFTCSNSFEESNTNEKPGLGLTNLKRRLELSYPERHSLKIEKSESNYQAILSIDS